VNNDAGVLLRASAWLASKQAGQGSPWQSGGWSRGLGIPFFQCDIKRETSNFQRAMSMVIPRSRSALSLSSTHAYLNDDCSETGAQISRPTPQTQTLDPGADFKPKARASEMLA